MPQWLVSRNQNTLRQIDRKSTRLNSSHANISYAVFCLKKKKKKITNDTLTNVSYTIQGKLPHPSAFVRTGITCDTQIMLQRPSQAARHHTAPYRLHQYT